jgi:hypothetical protein
MARTKIPAMPERCAAFGGTGPAPPQLGGRPAGVVTAGDPRLRVPDLRL